MPHPAVGRKVERVGDEVAPSSLVVVDTGLEEQEANKELGKRAV